MVSSLHLSSGVLRPPVGYHLVCEAVQSVQGLPPLEPGRSEGEERVAPEPGRPLSLEDDVTGLVDGSHVGSVAVLLGVDVPAHGGLTDYVESTVSDQREDVHLAPSALSGQDLTQLFAVTVHHL